MSLSSELIHPFQKVEDIVKAIVPDSLVQKYGAYAHTIGANLMHDASVAAKAGVAVAEKMSAALVSSVIAAIEQEAESLAPQVLSGKLSFDDAFKQGVGNLKSEAATSIVPGLAAIGEATLKTVLSTAASTAIATLAGNPISAQASSSVGSSSAQSRPSSAPPAPAS
jgi:hypothetical protein